MYWYCRWFPPAGIEDVEKSKAYLVHRMNNALDVHGVNALCNTVGWEDGTPRLGVARSRKISQRDGASSLSAGMGPRWFETCAV